MRFIAVVACLLVASLTAAQDQTTGGPNPGSGIARTATRAILGDEFPEDPQASAPADLQPAGEPEGFISEPRFIGRTIDYVTRTIGNTGRQTNGFYPEFSHMVTGSGWISAGPGYRQWLFGNRAMGEVSSAVSWRGYLIAQGTFELPSLAHSRLALGSQVLWQDATQITYFGTGPSSLESDRSEYRMKSTDLVGYATARPARWLSIGGRVGWLQRPTLLSSAGTFQRGYPDTQTQFPGEAAFALAEQPNYLHGQAAITADTRDSRSHPGRGGVYRTSMETYSDRDAGVFSFRRYEAEAAQFVPLSRDRIVLVFHAWAVASETAAGQSVPLYLEPSLGGHNTLRGYTEYRFHDRNLLVANAEARVAILTHLDFAAYVDAGNVAPRFGDLNLNKTSFGLGFRLHSHQTTFGLADIAHSAEGWQLLFRTSDPFHLSRLSRRTATTPFAP